MPNVQGRRAVSINADPADYKLWGIALRFSTYFRPSASEPSVVRTASLLFRPVFFYGSRRKGGRKAGLSCSEMKGAEWATGAEWQHSEERTGAGRIDQVHFCRRSSLGGRQRRGGGGGERTGMFMFPVANRSRGWQPSRIRRWPARNVPSVGAAGSIGSSHRLRCTTYEFLTWTTRVTWCTMDVNGTRVVASRVCRAETLHFATFVGCVCTDRLWR